jgi:hypothetical protein
MRASLAREPVDSTRPEWKGRPMDEELQATNIEIGQRESRGDRDFFEKLLAPAFAIRRARDNKIDDRSAFLDAVKESPPRETEVESIDFFGDNRALVVCTVTMNEQRFSNVRLFTRAAPDSPWQLLAWANEPA